jgi:4-hydroxybenzoate polyprenyltransferase
MADAATRAPLPTPPSSSQPRSALALLLALRPHQWAKNLLVFLPPLFNHAWRNTAAWRSALEAFIAISLCASAIYLLNDLMDAPSDRLHPQKSRRPIAAGALKPSVAIAVAAVLFAASAAVAFAMPLAFAGYLAAYAALALLYVFGAKRIAVLDIMILAALYTVRILAGGAATSIPVSAWLLAFSVFFFFSVALSKRCSELTTWGDRASHRPYGSADYRTLSVAGMAGGYAAVVVFAQYVHSPDTASLYRHPDLLWLMCPILLYWITRIWLLTNRGQMDEDAVLFALKDLPSYAAGLLAGIVLLCAL